MSALVSSEPGALRDILDVSVRNNQRDGITGMMLFADGNILQVLEGEHDTLHHTFHRIQRDTRHRGLLVLTDEALEQRQFASWSMGFHRLSDAERKRLPQAASVFRTHPDEISQRVQPSDALTLLRTFAPHTSNRA